MAAISKLVFRLPTASGSEQTQARSGAGGTCGQFFGRHFEFFISIFVLWLRHGGGWWWSSRLMANDEDDKEVTADAVVVVVVGPFCTLFRGQ